MVDLNKKSQKKLNDALEVLHFAFRALTAHPDEYLLTLGYSRVHHRVLYFIGRYPDSSINELLAIMKFSKQYLHRPLKRLIEDGYIKVAQDEDDKRIKRLRLSSRGTALEKKLTGEQREQLAEVFRRAGPQAEAGWRKVMKFLADGGDD